MMFKDVNAGSTNDPQNFLSLYFCTGASNTIGNYSNAEVDALVEELKGTFDLEKRAEIGAKASQIILDDCAYLFLAYPTYNIVTTSRIGGLKHYPVNFYLIDKDICVK
jgi:peptide/nickel transport system substrate-binding protein